MKRFMVLSCSYLSPMSQSVELVRLIASEEDVEATLVVAMSILRQPQWRSKQLAAGYNDTPN